MDRESGPGKPSREATSMSERMTEDLRKRVIDPAGRRTSVEHRRPSLSVLSLGDLSIGVSQETLSM